MHCNFSIKAWNAVSSYFSRKDDWRAYFDGADLADFSSVKPDLSFLPAIERRRLGVSARLAFAAAWNLFDQKKACPVVMASHDGEINRSFRLYLDLLRDGLISPMSFGLSVHNAICGQWTLFRQDNSEVSAIAASAAVLEAGIVESVGFLADGYEEVLLIVAEEPLAEEFAVKPYCRAPFPYALAMRITKGDMWKLERREEKNNQAGAFYWGAFNWIDASLSERLSFMNDYNTGNWQWSRL
ncbi:MAG: beta-ketoacyl synthase chain length factor [Cardiobacteriaceae bacterium]|nr:beta-ketoacyl synthase chain length factor [Cardiobacteriaceae bacterium]